MRIEDADARDSTCAARGPAGVHLHLIPGFHGGTDTSLVVAAVQSPLSADAHSANASPPRSYRDCARDERTRNMPNKWVWRLLATPRPTGDRAIGGVGRAMQRAPAMYRGRLTRKLRRKWPYRVTFSITGLGFRFPVPDVSTRLRLPPSTMRFPDVAMPDRLCRGAPNDRTTRLPKSNKAESTMCAEHES